MTWPINFLASFGNFNFGSSTSSSSATLFKVPVTNIETIKQDKKDNVDLNLNKEQPTSNNDDNMKEKIEADKKIDNLITSNINKLNQVFFKHIKKYMDSSKLVVHLFYFNIYKFFSLKVI